MDNNTEANRLLDEIIAIARVFTDMELILWRRELNRIDPRDEILRSIITLVLEERQKMRIEKRIF